MRYLKTPKLQLLMVLLLVALLPTLAAFQYHWLEELREAVHDRMERNMQWATFNFVHEFDGALGHIYRSFQVDHQESAAVPQQIALQYREWVADFSPSSLIDRVYWIHNHESRGLTLHQFNGIDALVELDEWPEQIAPLRREFFDALEYSDLQHAELIGPEPLQDEIPGLVIQQLVYRDHEELEDHREAAWILVCLNSQVLFGDFVPTLVEETFSSDGETEFDLAVVDRDDPDQILHASNPTLEAPAFAESDFEWDIYGLLIRDFPQRLWTNRRAWNIVDDHSEGEWLLRVRHQAGSLDQAVTAVRNRNLAISFGVLVLLGGSVLMLVITTRRAQRLAQQQMEFVAGISHELRTPLAVIRSAGENLTELQDADPQRTRTYGEIISREGRRLSQMVEGVLLFARMQSGRLSYELTPVAPGEILSQAIEASRPLLADEGVALVTEIADDLPRIRADGRALKSAVQNLLTNAAKYSPAGSTLELRAEAIRTDDTDQVRISVTDEGPGIPASELSRIFEPFYRGDEARETQTEGSGLGLSLVDKIMEAHDGEVTVRSEPGTGSTFVLQLAALEDGDDHPPDRDD